jgi:hypothetical protein
LFKAVAVLLAGLGLLPFFWAGLTAGDWSVARVTLVDPIVVAAICIALGANPRMRDVLRDVRARIVRVPRPVLIGLAAIFIVGTSVGVARLAYNGQPALTDELSQAFQGGIVMSGRLAAVAESHPEFFETGQTLDHDGRWFAEYPIGSGALVAIGRWTHLGIFVSPLLLVLAAVATWSFARRAYDETTARLALILMALSPFALFLAATRMNHVPTLALTAVALAALARWTGATPSDRRSRQLGSATLLGAALGGIVLFRPYDAMLAAVPIGIFQLSVVLRRRELIRSLGAESIAFLAVAGIQLWVNARTTGAPLLFGYTALNGPLHGPGFHLDPLGADFTPSRGLEYVMLYLQQLNTALFESAIPALVFIVVAMWLTRPTRWDWLLAGLVLSFLAGYGAYWHKGELTGPRFIYPAVAAFVVFAARFIVLTAQREKRLATGAALMLPVCVGLAFAPPFGHRSTGVWHRVSVIRTLPVSRSEDPAAEAKAAGLKNALVFVREPFHARLAARVRALGMAPFEAERAVADLDACALLVALDKSDAHPEIARPERLRAVLDEAGSAGKAQAIPGQTGFTALSLMNGRPSSPACYREMAEDNLGTLYFARFLAAATIDSTGRVGGDVVYARTLGARDSVLLGERFRTRDWYIYRRDDARNSGRFEKIR